ncbi:MAG: metal-dependent transcriptional regulator [Candidatus Hydrothermarchaeales archaeon]
MELSENIEEYLELLFVFEEKGDDLVRISSVSEGLGISPPSAVQMLKRLEDKGLVNYKKREGVQLTEKGRKVATDIIRNHRLIETLMKKTLNKDVDEAVVCGLEHHMSKEFADAICTLLEHPERCPHGNKIPRGECCKAGSLHNHNRTVSRS